MSALPSVYVSYDVEWGWLAALEFGRVDDGQPTENWSDVNEDFGYLHSGDAEDSPIVGFKLITLDADLDSDAFAPIWDGPSFAAPQLGLEAATAGEIILAARSFYGERSSLNRHLFHSAVAQQGEKALNPWTTCLHAGDPIAHFALGYTLYELDRHHEAYRHLRYYATIAPAQPWVHCWLGKAAEALGERDEARDAYRRAIELSEAGSEETDAPELLEALEQSGLPRAALELDGQTILTHAEADELESLLGDGWRLPHAYRDLELGEEPDRADPATAYNVFHHDLRGQLARAAESDPGRDLARGNELIDLALGRLLQARPEILDDVFGPYSETADYLDLVELLKRVGFNAAMPAERPERD